MRDGYSDVRIEQSEARTEGALSRHLLVTFQGRFRLEPKSGGVCYYQGVDEGIMPYSHMLIVGTKQKEKKYYMEPSLGIILPSWSSIVLL